MDDEVITLLEKGVGTRGQRDGIRENHILNVRRQTGMEFHDTGIHSRPRPERHRDDRESRLYNFLQKQREIPRKEGQIPDQKGFTFPYGRKAPVDKKRQRR